MSDGSFGIVVFSAVQWIVVEIGRPNRLSTAAEAALVSIRMEPQCRDGGTCWNSNSDSDGRPRILEIAPCFTRVWLAKRPKIMMKEIQRTHNLKMGFEN